MVGIVSMCLVVYVVCCCLHEVGSRAQATLHQELSICMGVRVVYIYKEGVTLTFACWLGCSLSCIGLAWPVTTPGACGIPGPWLVPVVWPPFPGSDGCCGGH